MSQESGWRRSVLFVVLGAVLATSVVGATVVLGAERTVMDQDYVGEHLEEAGVYESTAADMRAQFEQSNGTQVTVGLTEDSPEAPLDRMVESVVTERYVQGQVEANLDILYAYLEGTRQNLPLAFDLEPVKAGLATEMTDWVADLPPGDLSPRMGALAESRASFQETRENFTERQLQRIQNETPRHRTDPELRAIYDDRRDDVEAELVSRLESRVADGGAPESVQREAVDYGTVGIQALVHEDASYDRFQEREAAAHADLAAAVGTATRQRLDERQGDSVDLTEGLNGSTMQTLETARLGFSMSGLLLVVLPLVALGVAGAVGYLSRRRSRALWRVGVPVVLAGLLAVVASLLVPRLLATALPPEAGESAMGRAIQSIAAGVASTIGIQAAVVVVLGLVLVGLGVAFSRGMVPVPDVPEEPAATADTEGSDDGEGAEDQQGAQSEDRAGDADEPGNSS